MKLLAEKRNVVIAVACCCGIFAISLAASRTLFHRIPPPQNSELERNRNKLLARREAGKNNQTIITPDQPVGPIDRRVIAGGGGTSSGGTIKVDGTMGEPGASRTSSGGSMTVSGGFWNTIQGTATSTPTPTPTPTATPTPTPTPSPSPGPSPSASPAIQFDAAVYLVGEGNGHVTINVTRTGNTNSASTVDYVTADTDTFSVNCSAKQGQAYGRCDFATAVGTLSFAAGETTKNFVVPVIDDSYAEGNETFTVVLSNPAGATLGSPATAIVSISDNEISDGTNPILQGNGPGVDFFVRQHYLDFLGREPEPGQPWSAVLNGCPDQFNTNPGSPAAGCDRLTVSGAFFGSPEFKIKGIYVIDFYRVAFNRLPSYTEFSVDNASITGATGVETNAKRAAYATSFVTRTEFSSIYGAMTNAQFVNALMSGGQGQAYNLTSITTPNPANPDDGGPANKVTLTTTDLINQLNAMTLTRPQVLRAIVQSDQVTVTLEAVNAFVASQYYGYLRRAPDAGGFNGWVTYLRNNPNDFRTMINGFMNSVEYRLRFGPL